MKEKQEDSVNGSNLPAILVVVFLLIPTTLILVTELTSDQILLKMFSEKFVQSEK